MVFSCTQQVGVCYCAIVHRLHALCYGCQLQDLLSVISFITSCDEHDARPSVILSWFSFAIPSPAQSQPDCGSRIVPMNGTTASRELLRCHLPNVSEVILLQPNDRSHIDVPNTWFTQSLLCFAFTAGENFEGCVIFFNYFDKVC